jgi:branched-chain amino acid transport system substrate-binding protein
MISSTDATGQDVDRAVAEVLALPENSSIALVEHDHFNLTDLTVSAQIERIKSARAQALIAWSTGTSIATIFKSALQSGLDIPIGTTAGNYVYAQMQQFAGFLPRQLYLACALFPEHDGLFTLDPRVEAVQKNFYAILAAGKVLPDNMAGTSWDAGLIVVAALRQLGTDATAAQLKAYIAALTDFAGINGIYDFPRYPERGLGPDSTVVTVWNAERGRFLWASKPGGEPLMR